MTSLCHNETLHYFSLPLTLHKNTLVQETINIYLFFTTLLVTPVSISGREEKRQDKQDKIEV